MRDSLRDYQRAAVEHALLRVGANLIVVMPTGGGKTVTAAALLARLGGDALWVVHRRELVMQAARHVAAAGLRTRLIIAGERDDAAAGDGAICHVASVQTLARRDMPDGVRAVVVDECHHVAAESYQAIFDHACAVGVPVIGLTATPFRLDGRGLGEFFGEIIVAATIGDLVAAGHLLAPRVFCPPPPDVSGVKVVGGDFARGQVMQIVNTPQLVADIPETWALRRPAGAAAWRTVCYAAGIEHSRAIVAEFRSRGVRAEHLDGQTPRDERDGILAALRSGEIEVVSNVAVLTEGWDLPALECCIVARPTASLCLHIQMIGRVLRPSDGKSAPVVLDHAGNHHRHGLVTDPIEFSLQGHAASSSRDDGEACVTACPACMFVVPRGATRCPECGAEITRKPKKIEQIDGELVEFSPDAEFLERAAAWENFEADRLDRGYAEGWSYHRFREIYGEWPVVADGRLVNPRTANTAQKRDVYARLLHTARRRGFRDGWASHRYRDIFGVWPSGFVEAVRHG